jgi:homoserine kinase
MKQVTVTVTATTANLGPGFDCLGLALQLYNRFSWRPLDNGLSVIVNGEGAGKIPTDESNLAVRAAERLFVEVGQRPSGLALVQENGIPVGSGLGSSATAVVGGLLGANGLLNNPLSREELLALAVEMEGHADNVAPALYGGLTLVVGGDGLGGATHPLGAKRHIEKLPVVDLTAVIILPDFDLPTAEARAALPAQVPLADAIFNVSRMGLLVPALASGDYAKLTVAMQDRLHQPYRLPLIPGMAAAFTAVRQAGAAAVALSGAGPSLIAFAPDNHTAIGEAGQAAFAAVGLKSRVYKLGIDTRGAETFFTPA